MSDQLNEVTIVDYNPAWPTLFEEEKARLLSVAGAWMRDVQHVGSTAVPGLAAKPIIDIMIAIYDLADVEKCIAPIESLGYGYMGEYGLPERHFLPQTSARYLDRSHAPYPYGSERLEPMDQPDALSRLPARSPASPPTVSGS